MLLTDCRPCFPKQRASILEHEDQDTFVNLETESKRQKILYTFEYSSVFGKNVVVLRTVSSTLQYPKEKGLCCDP